jgi:hypothetical protein
VERPAGAQDQAQVDVGGRGDDALVEHQPDLLRQRVQCPVPHLRTGQWRVAHPQQPATSGSTAPSRSSSPRSR